jgi:hypothetical protein
MECRPICTRRDNIKSPFRLRRESKTKVEDKYEKALIHITQNLPERGDRNHFLSHARSTLPLLCDPKSRRSLFVRRIDHTVVQIMNICIRITSPSRERSALTATTKDCESQDEHQHLSATIKSSTNNVVVLDKQLWVAATHEPLREEPDDEEHGNTGVDSDEEPSHVPEYHRDVDVLEERMLGVAVSQPKWYGNEEAEEVGDGDPFVSTSDGE